MGEHYKITSWLCKLCGLFVKEGHQVLLAINNHAQCLDTTRKSFGCPRRFCPACKATSPAFPYHPFCVQAFLDAIPALQTSKKVGASDYPHKQANEALCKLGQALAFALPVDEPSKPDLSFRLLKQSFCQNVLGRISDRCNDEKCQCIACLFRQLSRLPPELLSEHILPHVAQSYVRQTVPMYGEIFKAFLLLEEYPAGDYFISCVDTVAQTCVCFGNESYITSLFNQTSPCSQTIKLRNEKPKYIVVWIDEIGVTDIKFLHSKTIHDLVQLDHKWVYTFPFTEEIHVKSKGVFLERITGSTGDHCRILWNSLQSPMLFEQEPFDQIATKPTECLVRYVSLYNVSAISVGFLSGAMVAIMSHEGTKYDFPTYAEIGASAVWAHFPLLLNEILEIWSVSYKDMNQGTRALVIITQWNLVWLGHYIPTEIWPLLQVTHIASYPVSALYYTDPSTSYSQIMHPRIKKQAKCPFKIECPTYRTPVPRHGMDICDLFYSEAPLEGVIQVQSCLDTGRCIGLLLQYKGYSQTVGEFRYDKEISDYFHEPWSIGLIQEQHDSASRVRIEFSKEVALPGRTGDDHMRPMSGIVVWWYSRNMSVVSII